MAPVGYLICVSTVQSDREVILSIRNIAGLGQPFFGSSGSTGNIDLWIIPNGKANREEVLTKLRDVAAIRHVSIVALSNPVTVIEIGELREMLLKEVGWDSSSVTDDEMALFLNSKLQWHDKYYIDYDHKEYGKSPVKIQIKLVTDHPNFSPEWIKRSRPTEVKMPDRELTLDDFKTETIEHVEMVEVKAPPSPPPYLAQMKDEEIKQWCKKNIDVELKDENIVIARNSEEVIIDITFDDQQRKIRFGRKIL
jgi:hypothetical protein